MLRWLMLQNYNDLIGLDISSHSLKLLKINTSTTPNKIEKFATAALPSDAIVKGEVKDAAAVANTLKNLIKQADITTKDFALAISRSSAIIKNITVDSRLSEDEIESRVWIEAKHHFPELIGDIYLDFSILGPSAQDATQMELALVACRKDALKPYLEILNTAGLSAKIVDVNSYALERAVTLIAKRFPELKTIALLNLDLTLSNVIVVHNGKLIYSHDETFDGNRLVKQVREIPKDVPNYFEILKENLSAHLRHIMHFFYSSRPNISIEKMLLSGDCSVLANLPVFIQQETAIETEIANPFIDMPIDAKINADEFKQHASTLMLSCGLALSSLK